MSSPARTPTFRNVPPEVDLVWVAFTDRLGVVHASAEVDLPDRLVYHDGFKPATLLAIGDLTRALSNREGALDVPTVTCQIFDVDGTWRALAADPDTADFVGLPFVIYGIPDADRRLETAPVTLWRGVVREHHWDDLVLSITSEDPITKALAANSDGLQLPRRTVVAEDFPNCGQTIVVSSAEQYLVQGAHAVGETDVLVRDGIGQFGAGDLIQFNNTGDTYRLAGSSKRDALIGELLAAETPETKIVLELPLTAPLADGATISVGPAHNVAPSKGTPVPFGYGLVSDYAIVDGVDQGDGQGPIKYLGDATNDDRITSWFLWYGHRCYEPATSPAGSPFLGVYFFNNPVDLDTLAGSGERLAVPGYPRFDECAPTGSTAGLTYVTINGREYTILGLQGVFRDWALGIAPTPPNLGGVPVAVSATGHVDADGALITSGPQVYKHVIKNYIYGDYQGGDPLEAPTFDDASPALLSMVDDDSFDAVERQQGIRLVGGYRLDFGVGFNNERVPAGTLLARLNHDNAADAYFSHEMQYSLAMVEDDEATALGTATSPPVPVDRLDDVNDILDESGQKMSVDDQDLQIANAKRFGHTADYFGRAPGRWRSILTGFNEVSHAASVSRHGKVYDRVAEFWCIRGKNRSTDPDDYQQGSDTVDDILQHELRRTSEAPRVYTIPTGMRGFNATLELGRVMQIKVGKDIAGRIDRPVRILSVRGRPGSSQGGHVVVFTAEDQTRLYTQALSITYALGVTDASA